MKDISKTNANKIYKLAKDNAEGEIEIEIPSITDSKGNPIKVSVRPHVSLSIQNAIVEEVTAAAMIDNEYNPIYRNAQMAKCVIQYMTNLPLPMVVNDVTKEEYVDLNLCNDIVHTLLFSDSTSVDLYSTYSFIIDAVMDNVQTFRNVSEKAAAIEISPVGKLCRKILDMCDSIKAELEDMKENPASFMDLIDNIANAADDIMSAKK